MSAILGSAPAATKSLLDGKTTLMRFPHLVQNPPRKIAPELGMLGGVAAAAGQVVDTYDWDTVFAIRFSDVNTELAKPGSTPATFTSTDTGVTASGNFGQVAFPDYRWQLGYADVASLSGQPPTFPNRMYLGALSRATGEPHAEQAG